MLMPLFVPGRIKCFPTRPRWRERRIQGGVPEQCAFQPYVAPAASALTNSGTTPFWLDLLPLIASSLYLDSTHHVEPQVNITIEPIAAGFADELFLDHCGTIGKVKLENRTAGC